MPEGYLTLLLLIVSIIFNVFLVYKYISLLRNIQKQRKDAVEQSRAVTSGKVSEQLAPYLSSDFNFNPQDARFLGNPVDFVVFDGLSEEKDIIEVIFIEVKTGASTLNKRQRRVRDAVKAGLVKWKELRMFEKNKST
jgi:predicted Holliday junction resolvase-like endonuclease